MTEELIKLHPILGKLEDLGITLEDTGTNLLLLGPDTSLELTKRNSTELADLFLDLMDILSH